MFTALRPALALAGSWLLTVSFLARLPGAMSQLGTLLLVSQTTGSLTSAGLATGAVALGSGVSGPALGWLSDRYGQRPVVVAAALANTAALLTLVVSALGGTALPGLLVLAATVGLTTPQVGPLARSRWVAMITGRPDAARMTGAAMSFEGAADELSYVFGPALVGLLTLLHPAVPLLVAAVLALFAGVTWAVHRTAPSGQPATRGGGRLPVLPLAGLCLAMVLQGIVFGSTQAGVIAATQQAGQPALAGLTYALLGLTSAVAGLATAALPERWGLGVRLQVASVAMAALAIPLLMVQGVAGLAVAVGLFGFAIAPHMITVYRLGERFVPQPRLGAAMGLLSSGVVVGYALGTSLGGSLADAAGAAAPFAVTVGAAALAALVALVGRRLRQTGARIARPV